MSFVNPVVGGEGGELVRASIKSPDYVPSISGWIIRRDGSAEFNNVTIRVTADIGEAIVIGPSDGPQVVIATHEFAGLIEFPSNTSFETRPASIRVQSTEDDPVIGIDLRLESAEVAGGDTSVELELISESQDLNTPAEFITRLTGTGQIEEIRLHPGEIELHSDLVTTRGELYSRDNRVDGNYPIRVVRGRVNNSSVVTPLSKVANTLVDSAETTGVYLENGVAYRVEIQIRTVALSAPAGTQGVVWSLWDGAIGGTQLGQSVQTYMEAADNNQSSQGFSFIFEHVGTSALRTLNLGARHFEGSENVSAVVSPQYFMLVSRIGEPSRIVNL